MGWSGPTCKMVGEETFYAHVSYSFLLCEVFEVL